MEGRGHLIRTLLICFTIFTIIYNCPLVWSQGLQTPYSAADSVRRGLSGPPDMTPSSPLGLPRGSVESDSIPISSGLFQGLLPNIPNLQLGYIYNFGQNVRSGRARVDYLLPVNLGPDTTVYAETHAEFQSFWKTLSGAGNNRTDLSFGGGYRRMIGNKTLVGVNGFYDTSRLFRRWYSSGSAGIELAAEIAGNDAIDMNFNWYGRLFNSAVLSNAFRYGPSNYDFQVGYSHELWNGGPDLRLSATGYKFQSGSNVYGYYAGTELKTRDGMFVLKSDIGHDKINKTYYTVGGYINVGLQLENLLSGKSPLTMPEPIFKSPRNLRRLLTKTADRNWYQPTSVVVNRNYTPTTTTTPTPDPPPPPPPPPECVLTGQYRVLTSYIAQGSACYTIPQLPSSSSEVQGRKVIIRWCGIQNPSSTIGVILWIYTNVEGSYTRYVIVLGGNAGAFQFSTTDGEVEISMMDESQTTLSVIAVPTVHFTFTVGYDHIFEFEPGGGITLTIE